MVAESFGMDGCDGRRSIAVQESAQSRHPGFTSTFNRTAEDSSSERRNGLTLAHLDSIRVECSKLVGTPAQWWQRIEEKIELYTSPEEVDG